MKKLNKNILIISKSQFGYNYNSVSLFNILLENNISFCYLGYNEGKKNYSLVSDYYELIEVSFSKSKLLNNIKFFITIIKTLNRYEIIYVFYFYGCSILKLIFPKKKFILDIRTGSIFKGSLKKYLANKLLKFESKFFDKLSIISESLLRKLEIKNKNVKIVPVIPHKIKFIKRNFDEIYLLYVGTLKNRNIIDTVLGLYNLITKHPDYSNIIKNYRIVCDNGDELTELKKLINELKLNDKILVFDWVTIDELEQFYNISNVGVSYIPINDVYNCQPPIKTYEYLLAGMPVLATKTLENQKLINEGNGILFNDGANSFTEALLKFIKLRQNFDSEKIYCSISEKINSFNKNDYLDYILN